MGDCLNQSRVYSGSLVYGGRATSGRRGNNGWARDKGYVVFTHDLDFGAALALTQAEGPSVIQVRTQDVTPQHLEPSVINVLENHAALLDGGCLIVLDEGRSRVRVLPLTLRS